MKLENGINWCDATTNAVTGCSRVSEGCRFCYAEAGTRARVLRAQGIETWGPKGVRHPVNFEPVFRRLNKLCICDRCHETFPVEKLFSRDDPVCRLCLGDVRRIRLFADSNSDWLDERWLVGTLARFLDAIRQAPNVDVILLTKRPENFKERIAHILNWDTSIPPTDESWERVLWIQNWWAQRNIPANLWLGVSVENQAMADKRIPELLKLPASVRFLSVEPLLEKIELPSLRLNLYGEQIGWKAIDWVICGGESGPNRRDCGVEAIVSVAEQCKVARVPCYVKQDCAFKSGQQGRIPNGYWTLKNFPLTEP